MHARRKGRPIRQTIVSVFGGVITTNMLSPIVYANSPEAWHYTLFFLVGWGGLELVDRLYESAAQGLERRVNKTMGGSGDVKEDSGEEAE
ncbi:hypothetical protein LJC46_04295 [Desulfovibrio sp. OttesenSCG-928-G15]|nr:hypothetical protein [Desulfovibrio sp. OttesenSCG-928-G15]